MGKICTKKNRQRAVEEAVRSGRKVISTRGGSCFVVVISSSNSPQSDSNRTKLSFT